MPNVIWHRSRRGGAGEFSAKGLDASLRWHDNSGAMVGAPAHGTARLTGQATSL
ncbi:MAG: hypothetical protein SFW64_08525 [Alphaproteobacteria bacterium]|nr:hypothetical protein [Alphaproteobacteria bacterium]